MLIISDSHYSKDYIKIIEIKRFKVIQPLFYFKIPVNYFKNYLLVINLNSFIIIDHYKLPDFNSHIIFILDFDLFITIYSINLVEAKFKVNYFLIPFILINLMISNFLNIYLNIIFIL